MQISLKQREIEAALRAYIVAQGFSLSGKAVEISFTATRAGGAGIVAELDIEDALTNLSTMPVGLPSNLSVANCVSAQAAEEVQAESAPEEVPEPAPGEEAPEPAKAVSLFG